MVSVNIQLKAVLAALAEDASPDAATVFFPAYKASAEQPIKVKLETILEAVVAGSANWGNIGGVLANQTDLQNALNSKAPLASAALTGVPTAPTAAPGTNTAQVATTEFTQTALANLINAAPGALDQLNELAAALGNDANYAATVANALAGKVPNGRTISAGSGLSGGGDLSANRTINLNIDGLPETEDAEDVIFIAVHTENGVEKISRDNFLAGIGGGVVSSPLSLVSNGATETPLSVKAASGQSVDWFAARNSVDVVKQRITSAGVWEAIGGINVGSIENISPNALSLNSAAGIRLYNSNAAFVLYHNGAERLMSDANGFGFFGATPIAKPTITGSRGGNAALASLLSYLEDYGLIIDSSS